LPTLLVAHLHFFQTHKAKLKNAKEPPSQRTTTVQTRPDRATKDRTTAANSGFKKLAVQWLNEVLCFVSSSLLADSFVLRNRQLLKPANR